MAMKMEGGPGAGPGMRPGMQPGMGGQVVERERDTHPFNTLTGSYDHMTGFNKQSSVVTDKKVLIKAGRSCFLASHFPQHSTSLVVVWPVVSLILRFTMFKMSSVLSADTRNVKSTSVLKSTVTPQMPYY